MLVYEMKIDLDQNFNNWLHNLSQKWQITPGEFVRYFAKHEIENRLINYPILQSLLLLPNLGGKQLRSVLEKCNVSRQQNDITRIDQFLNSGSQTIDAIQTLVGGISQNEEVAVNQIDDFIQTAANLNYLAPNGKRDNSGVAQFASLLLTTAYSDRFVDFRQNRWQNFSHTLGEMQFPYQASYGKKMVWTGQFAKAVVETPTFQYYWHTGTPLWVLAGICRPFNKPLNREQFIPDPEQVTSKLPERRRSYSMRLIRDTKQTLQVKERYDYTCQVCGVRLEARQKPYAEGAHIRPLGGEHAGSDSEDNILCLCPNHHALFDMGGFAIEDNFQLIGLDGALAVHSEHLINPDNIRYHRRYIYGNLRS